MGSNTVSRLRKEKVDAFHGLDELELVVTCRWAGVGGMIIAVLFTKKALEDLLGINVKLRIHSVGDWDRCCQQFLTHFKPEHMFGDADAEFDSDLVQEIAAKQIKFADLVNSGRMMKAPAIAMFKRVCEGLANKYVPGKGSPCLVCGKRCSVVPARAAGDDCPGVLWLDLASPPCTPWSPMGTRMQWLCPSQRAVVLYAMGLRHNPPDLLLLEDVPQFDRYFFQSLVGGKMVFQDADMAPTDVGIPCTGTRLWLVGNTHDLPGACGLPEKLSQTVVRPQEAWPDIWLLADKAAVDLHVDHANAVGAKLKPHPRGKRFRPEDCLADGYANRLHVHRLRGAMVRETFPDLANVGFYYDISQNPAHTKRPDGLMPRQLTSSVVWVEHLARPMLPLEMWAGQGLQIICVC